MQEQILIQGEPITRHRGIHDFLPGVLLSAGALCYGLSLYGKNAEDCRTHFIDGYCMPEWDHSFPEFLRLSMGPHTVFPAFTVLLWCGLLALLAGACLFLAFYRNEITVTKDRIYGRAAFGTRVQVSFPAVLDAEALPGHRIRLVLYSGSLIFGGIKNHREVCSIIRENAVLPEAREKKRVQIGSRGPSGLKLGTACFLPFLICFLPILIWGEPSLGKAWETYWGWEKMEEKFSFLSFWLAEQMSQVGSWPIGLIYIAFPALLAGVFFFCGRSRQKILVTDSRVQGRGSFRAAFDLPLSEVKAAAPGPFHSIILHHAHGSISIHGIRNRTEVLSVLEKSLQQGETEEIPTDPQAETLESRTVSDQKLAILCFLPALAFFLLLAMGIYRNAGFCREVYESVETIQKQHSYPEYLLIWALSGNPGRWIKAFFWISLMGIYGFFACRGTALTFQGKRICGRSRWGGYLEAETDSICGVSMNPFGKLILYTESGKFIFGPLKDRREFYEYFHKNPEG